MQGIYIFLSHYQKLYYDNIHEGALYISKYGNSSNLIENFINNIHLSLDYLLLLL